VWTEAVPQHPPEHMDARRVSESWGPATGITREEHDLWVALRGRPLTDGSMRAAKTESDAGDGETTHSIIDRVIANARRETQ
jgi:hypothetical protein